MWGSSLARPGRSSPTIVPPDRNEVVHAYHPAASRPPELGRSLRRGRSTTVNRSPRLAALAATALLVLAGCSSPASTSAAAPSTVPASARPERIRLHGRVAFASDRHGNDEVYVMNADGSRQGNLTRDPASDYSPAWSPDGRRIAFATGRADPSGNDLWLMAADGSDPRPLVHQRGIDEYPVWSPDGSRLAFGCTLGRILPSGVGDFEVCVVNADGSGLRRITDAPGISAAGGWTPDGRRIVFTSSRDQDPAGVSSCGHLYLVNSDGSHLTRLTNAPARDCGPRFTPDGRHIQFSSDRADPGGDSDLYAMNSDGSAVTRLTDANSEEQEAAFTPCKGACP
jgi:Tol biopolymer transport system component